MSKEYRIPTLQPIGGAARALYKTEALRTKYIKQAATEQAKLLGFKEGEYWTHAIPEQLAAVLDSFDRGAAEAAAVGFLRSRGYVTMPPNEVTEHISIVRALAALSEEPGVVTTGAPLMTVVDRARALVQA